MTFTELFTPAAIAANWSEAASNRTPYLGEILFPAKKKAGLDLAWLKGSKGLPVSLMPSAFDTKATYRDRIGVQKIETEMPFFREGFKIKERDRQELLRVADSNDPYAQEVMARVYDDATNLIEGAAVVPERMRMSLLFPTSTSTGITIKANGTDYTYAYGTGNYTALSGTSLWTADSTADPFAAIQTVKDARAAATGAEIRTVIMNRYTFNLLTKIQAVKNRFITANGVAVGYLAEGDVKAVMRDTCGVDIVIYDKMYKNENGVAAKFVPDGYVALIPNGAIGGTWYGTTPEEADLNGSGKADVALVNTGVAVTRIVDEHPVNINILASEIVLPSFEAMDDCACMKVIA